MKGPKVQDGLFALRSISYHFSALFSISRGLRLYFPASRPAGLLLGLPGGLGRRLEAARRVELGVCVALFLPLTQLQNDLFPLWLQLPLDRLTGAYHTCWSPWLQCPGNTGSYL